MKHDHKHTRFTLGVLAGWQAHAGAPDSFLHEVFRGVQAAAIERDCNLLLAYGIGLPSDSLGRPAWPVLVDEADFVPIGPWNTDGLVVAPPIAPSEAGSRYFAALQEQGYPLVFAGTHESGAMVAPDNALGVRQALSHLVEHGHRRIAMIAGDRRSVGDSAARLRAYQAFLEEFGLECDPALIAYGNHTLIGGRRAMAEIIDGKAPFSAVFVSNDPSAKGALETLRATGRSVPGDVALISFDDRVESRAAIPQMTTVHYPIFEVGYQAVLLLLKYLESEEVAPITIRVLPHLVVRESCGCLPGEMPVVPSWDLVEAESSHAFDAPPLLTADAVMASVVEILTEAAVNETHRLSLREIRSQCAYLVKACWDSLHQGDALIFRRGVQQILEYAASQEDGFQGWQTAIAVLRESLPLLRKSLQSRLTDRQVEDMLHQARVAVSEMIQGQQSAYLVRQTEIVNQINRMTARFHMAQEESEVFATLEEYMPPLGIRHVVVAFYEAEAHDPISWSVAQCGPPDAGAFPKRFPSRTFPPDGLYPTHVPFHLVVLPLLFQGELIGFAAFDMGNMDLCAGIAWQLVTALRGVRLYRAAVEGQRLAEEANRLKSRFLSMVSHELRAPLNLISGLSDLLLREPEAESASPGDASPGDGKREDLQRIYVNAQHLDGLIRDVLDMARSEAGQLWLMCEPLDMAEVLAPVIMIAQQLARDKDLAWRVELPEALPQVWGDRIRLRQVLLNLVNNAIKFTAHGEVALTIAVQDDVLTVTVRDTGLGIPLEEQAVIFDEFRQSVRTTARGYGGLGLGLAICKRLVEMHGGCIGARSSGEENSGSEFYFTVPVMPPARPVAPETDPGALNLQRVALLVQNVEQGRALKEHLLQQGLLVTVHAVSAAPDWCGALLAEAPDAVVLDQAVAAMHGWEVIRLLKETPQTRNTPVLFYALDGSGDRGAFLQVDFLTKPVKKAQLAEVLIGQGLQDAQNGVAGEKTILIVEDDADILDVHTRIVRAQSSHYRILQARDGLEALDVLRRERPDLVLLDLRMPGLDGFGVLEAMRNDDATRNIPVVILTAQVLADEDMARLNRGVVRVLGKGLFTVGETLQHIETVLARRRKAITDAQQLPLKAMAYIHMHYAEPVARSDIASAVGLSERHLSRCFQQEVGITPMAYLNRYRIKQAKTLLEAGGMGITAVALAVGFSSGGYFTRVFRQETGVSPRDYRANSE